MMHRGHRNLQRGGAIVNLIILLFFALLCAIIYFARHPLMRFAAESWIVDEPAPHADVIVILGDDNFYADRATHAAELFRQGIAPLVVASGRRLRPNAAISELMEHDLIERGVPKDKILPAPQDYFSEEQEAIGLRRLASEKHWKSVLLVTSNYNTRRARYIFHRIFPPAIVVSVASARDGDFDPELWWEKRQSSSLFAGELLGMASAWWELRSEP